MRLQSSRASFLGNATVLPAAEGRPARDILKRLGLVGPQDQVGLMSAGAASGASPGAVIQLDQALDARGLATTVSLRRQADTEFATQIRTLLTTLSARPGEEARRKVVVAGVTSPADATRVSASLAVMCAIMGYKVGLIDCNLGRPRLHDLFGLSNEVGLSNLLLEQYSAPSLLQSCAIPNLTFMAAGPRVEGDAGLLLRERVLHRIEQASAEFDFVFLDCATLPPGLVASAAAGATDVIVGAKRHASSLRSLRDMLGSLGEDGIENASVLILE